MENNKTKNSSKGQKTFLNYFAQNHKILSQDVEIAKIFKEYFINIPILNMRSKQGFSTQTRSLKEDTISEIIDRYKDHRNINLIKSKNSCMASTFFFKPVWKAPQEKVYQKF